MLSECFKAMGAGRSCHRTPSVGHLAGADASSNINGLAGSDENPGPLRGTPPKTNVSHLEKNDGCRMFFPFENGFLPGDILVLGGVIILSNIVRIKHGKCMVILVGLALKKCIL